MENNLINLIASEKKYAQHKAIREAQNLLYDRYIEILEDTSDCVKKYGYDAPEVKIREDMADEIYALIKRFDQLLDEMDA